MSLRFRCVLATLATWALLGLPAQAQSRKLGPETAKSIQQAKLDPAFQTTKLNRIAVLPFANTQQHREAAAIISRNLVSQLSQLHPEYQFIPPDEMINFISKSQLDDPYNIFLGDYLSSGTARQDFLRILREQLQIDAVFVGQITAWGAETQQKRFLGAPIKTKVHVVGLEMSLYRTTDGRRIWYGKDLIAAQNADKLQQAAETIGEVFARFFGRLPY